MIFQRFAAFVNHQVGLVYQCVCVCLCDMVLGQTLVMPAVFLPNSKQTASDFDWGSQHQHHHISSSSSSHVLLCDFLFRAHPPPERWSCYYTHHEAMTLCFPATTTRLDDWTTVQRTPVITHIWRGFFCLALRTLRPLYCLGPVVGFSPEIIMFCDYTLGVQRFSMTT